MSLVREQSVFLLQACELIRKAGELGFSVSAGELYRTPEQQALHVKNGRSTTMSSQHLKRLAIDLNFFRDGPDGTPHRLGFALGNEFSDHVTEKFNYLWLAHSKLRQCSFGPELRTGPLPAAVTGASRVRRGNQVIFDKPFLSGEDNMSHTIANLEAHHFKYSNFRRPGDVHVHFFGTATLSFSAGVITEPGDVFEIEADAFLFPLRNALSVAPPEPLLVTAL